ncbi:MAG: HAMP domain-containing sensor histidine kinase [Thermoplasmata archaeon]
MTEMRRLDSEHKASGDGNKASSFASGLIDDIVSLSSDLLVLEHIEDFVERLVHITISHFPVRALIVYLMDESGNFLPKFVYGFPEDRVNSIINGATYSRAEVEEMELTVAKPLGRFSKFYPAELVDINDDRELLTTLDLDKIHEPRRSEDEFHPLDAAVIRFLDRSSREIGSLFICATTTGKKLDDESIMGLELLASFASIAIEFIGLRKREERMLSSLEKRAMQTSQIYSVTNSIMAISEPKELATRVLKIIKDLFGFTTSCIALYDPSEECYRWQAFEGYSKEQVERAMQLRVPKEIAHHDIKPEFRIGYLAHFKPAEKTLPEDLPYHFTFASIEEAERAMNTPRSNPNTWHPLDDLTFPIYDRNGQIIGLISPDMPLDNQIPDRDSLELIEVFVSMVAIAFENAAIYQEASDARDEVRMLNRLMFHDLMNYSMAIRGYLDLSLSQSSEAMIDRYIDRAMRQLDQISDLISKVRKLSIIKSADKRNLMRIDLATTIINQAHRTAGLFPIKKVSYNFDIESKEAYVMANDLLPDLFHNIFMNAIKFDAHESVTIDVSLKKIVDDPSDPKSAYWQVSVADRGPGIPEERKQQIFLGSQRMTTSEPGRGMGLGLSIVKSLVNLYGGRIWVEDRVPRDHTKGSVFKVKLPAA